MNEELNVKIIPFADQDYVIMDTIDNYVYTVNKNDKDDVQVFLKENGTYTLLENDDKDVALAIFYDKNKETIEKDQ